MNSDHQLVILYYHEKDVKGNRTGPKSPSLTNHKPYVLRTLLHLTREVERSR